MLKANSKVGFMLHDISFVDWENTPMTTRDTVKRTLRISRPAIPDLRRFVYNAATTPASTMPKPAPARPPFKLSAPPVDCSTTAEDVADPLWLAALVDEVPLEVSLDVPETTVVAASEALEEEAAAADEAELPLEAAEVALAAPEAHVAAVGRLLTPWPAQSDWANWSVSVMLVSSVYKATSRVEKLTLLVLDAAGGADTAREAAQQVGAAADALHIKTATGAERAANTAGCATGKTRDLRCGERGQQSYGGESESVHGCCVSEIFWRSTRVSINR
jgi:hypothetical protein